MRRVKLSQKHNVLGNHSVAQSVQWTLGHSAQPRGVVREPALLEKVNWWLNLPFTEHWEKRCSSGSQSSRYSWSGFSQEQDYSIIFRFPGQWHWLFPVTGCPVVSSHSVRSADSKVEETYWGTPSWSVKSCWIHSDGFQSPISKWQWWSQYGHHKDPGVSITQDSSL